MDWHLLLFGASVALAAVAAIVGAFWRMLDLVVKPIQSDILEIKTAVKGMNDAIRPVEELDRRALLLIGQHASECGTRTASAIAAAVAVHEKCYHK